ncbi:preprotein translocase subunit SecY, partial [Bacillus nitratireducens]|nr:preprotein translocase subunit SecY [Bacillus nitratireducens]
GNGIPMIIFEGLVTAIPNVANHIYLQQFQNAGHPLFKHIIKMVLIGHVILAITVGVIYIQQAVRKIPMQYAKAVSGHNQYQGAKNNHLP